MQEARASRDSLTLRLHAQEQQAAEERSRLQQQLKTVTDELFNANESEARLLAADKHATARIAELEKTVNAARATLAHQKQQITSAVMILARSCGEGGASSAVTGAAAAVPLASPFDGGASSSALASVSGVKRPRPQAPAAPTDADSVAVASAVNAGKDESNDKQAGAPPAKRPRGHSDDSASSNASGATAITTVGSSGAATTIRRLRVLPERDLVPLGAAVATSPVLASAAIASTMAATGAV